MKSWSLGIRDGIWVVGLAWCLALGRGHRVGAAEAAVTNAPVSPKLTLQRIFGDGEFSGDSFGGRWMDKGHRYTTFESVTNGVGGRDLVAHDAATGAKEVLVPSARRPAWARSRW